MFTLLDSNKNLAAGDTFTNVFQQDSSTMTTMIRKPFASDGNNVVLNQYIRTRYQSDPDYEPIADFAV